MRQTLSAKKLVQANRIAGLRERRCETKRREAQERQAECESHNAESESALMLQKRQREEAEHLLIANPADPQSQLWRSVNREREAEAKAARDKSHEELVTACSEAANARREHERCQVRSRIFADQLSREQRMLMIRAEDLEAEDAEQTRTRANREGIL